MEYNKSRIKIIHFWNEIKHLLTQKNLHTIFRLGTKDLTEFKLNEPILITTGDDEPKPYGMSEIIGLKACCIRDLEETDLERQKPGFQSKIETIETFREIFPEDRADIGMNTPVTVITIKTCNYDLKSLNKSVRPKVEQRKMGQRLR